MTFSSPAVSVTGTGGPGWLREFESTLSVHAQFVFHGNIHDQFVVPGGAQLTSLPLLLWDVLRTCGFESVITFDQVDGIGVHPARGPGADTAALAAGRLVNGVGRRPQLTELRTDIDAVVNAADIRSAFMLGHASRLTIRPGSLDPPERDFFLFCAKLAARALHRGGPGASVPYNPVIWLVENGQDLPSWLTVGNAHVRSIAVPPPDLGDRLRAARLLTSDYAVPPGDSPTAAADVERTIEAFAIEAHGLTLEAMAGVTQLARERGIEFERLPDAVATYRLGVVENPWRQPHLRQQISRRQGELSRRVKGQPQAVAKALDVLKRAAMGMSGSHTGKPTSRPRGVLFFAGPTGVGKTELAKSIAQLIYGDEGALIRFDMSEFSEAHAADRLIGSPPGYVGYEAGGQLTNAVRRQPFSVVLFDEIEKASRQVLDKFLQILEDGRLTDGRGDTTYFSESILIFTSNLGVQETDQQTGTRRNLVEPGTPYAEVERAVRNAVGYHFRAKIGRPELLNRFGDNIVVFNFIDPDAAEAIFASQVDSVRALLAREHDISLDVEGWVMDRLRAACTNELTFGGRGIGNQVEAMLVNPLARALFDREIAPGAHVTISALDLTVTPPTLELICRG